MMRWTPSTIRTAEPVRRTLGQLRARLPRPALPALAAVAVLLTGCSDDVSWAFISNSQGGTLIVVKKSSAAWLGGSSVLSVAGEDDTGEVLVHLPTEADVAVLCYKDAVQVRTPALPEGSVEIAGGQATLPDSDAVSVLVHAPDAAVIDARAIGPGRLHVAAGGTLLVLEHRGGAVVFRPAEEPESSPPGTLLEERGAALRLLLPDRTVRLLTPPEHPTPAQRIGRAGGTGRIQVLGPAAEVVAVLPEDAVELHSGAAGLFLTASFRGGLNEQDRTPMELAMASHNRFLLRLE